MINIFLADDHEIVREGLTRLIDKQHDMMVVGYAENGMDALRKINTLYPDVVIMDTGMPILSGIEATPLIHKAFPNTKIILYSINRKEEYIHKSFMSGATGYVFKLSTGQDILDSIHAALRGEYYVSPPLSKKMSDVCKQVMASPMPFCRYNLLSPLEQLVFRLMVEGFSHQDISKLTASGSDLIASMSQSISEKLQLETMDDMIRYAEDLGIITPGTWSDCDLNPMNNSTA